MAAKVEPIEAISLKEACIKRLEGLILSGTFDPGERLPSERDLAAQLGVSRPVLHQAIVALDAKGLVQIEARRGVFVKDYRKDGSIAMLMTLMEHSDGSYKPELLSSLIAARTLVEQETARSAARHASEDDLRELVDLIERGKTVSPENILALIAYDFDFHQQIAILSGNLIYPLLINSLKSVHTNLAGMFYREYAHSQVLDQVLDFHADLVAAIQKKNADQAASIMAEMLKHGEEFLLRCLPQD